MHFESKNSALVDLVVQLWPLTLFFILCCRLLWNKFGTGISRVPGPLLQSCSQIPRFLQVWAGRVQEHDLDLHRKYGKTVRIGPRLVSVADPEDINTIYGISTKFYKSSFYEPSTAYDEEGIIPDPFVLRDKAMHNRMKKNAANAYSLSALVQLEPYLAEVANKLFVQLDKEAARPGNVVDFGQWMHYFAMDVVFMLSFGKTLNLLEKGDESKILAAFDTIMPYMATIGQMPWMHKFLAGNRHMSKLILGEMTFEAGLIDIATSQVEEFKKDLKDRSDDAPTTFIQRLLLNQKANPKSLTDREIITHALGNITAGGDTTSITLRSIIYYSLKNPDSYRKLCEEVRLNCTFPTSFQSAKDLPYLNAVVKEALRLHPPFQIMLGRTVPAGGAKVGGYYLPAGTEVGISPYVLHRDPEVYPDPDSWKPERWLTEDKAKLAIMNRSALAFGTGPHTCSGRHISMLEILTIIPELLLRYDFKLAYPERNWYFRTSMLAPQKGIYVTLTKRM